MTNDLLVVPQLGDETVRIFSHYRYGERTRENEELRFSETTNTYSEYGGLHRFFQLNDYKNSALQGERDFAAIFDQLKNDLLSPKVTSWLHKLLETDSVVSRFVTLKKWEIGRLTNETKESKEKFKNWEYLALAERVEFEKENKREYFVTKILYIVYYKINEAFLNYYSSKYGRCNEWNILNKYFREKGNITNQAEYVKEKAKFLASLDPDGLEAELQKLPNIDPRDKDDWQGEDI